MKKLTFFVRAILVFAFIAFTIEAVAQTPGLIYSPASGIGPSVMDPNGDGFTSATRSGFSGTDFGSASELPMLPLPQFISEPISDLTRGSTGGVQDMVSFNGGNSTFILKRTVNGVDYLMVRMRLGGQSPAAKGYSVLIDIDNQIGNFPGDNPGFEREINLQSGNNGSVVSWSHNGSTATVIANHDLSVHHQRSIAVSTNGSDLDYFYDFFVPFSSLNISSNTALRFVAATVINPTGALTGNVSDMHGVNDAAFGNNFWAIATAMVNSVPAVTLDQLSTGFVFPALVSLAPTITSQLTLNSTSISGVSLEANGTIIEVFNGSTSLGTTTVTDNSWTLTGVSGLAVGNIITAKASATSKSISGASNAVTVTGAQTCYTPIPVITTRTNGSQSLSGTWSTGTTASITANTVQIKVYQQTAGSNTFTLLGTKSPSPASVFVATNGTWSYTVNLGQNDFNSAALFVTATLNSCESGLSNVAAGNAGSVPTAPTISTSPVLANTGAQNISILNPSANAAATLILYKNGVQIGSVANVGSNATGLVSATGLLEGDRLEARVLISSLLSNLSPMVLVSGSSTPSRAPIISGSYLAGSNVTITGTSTELPGTVITLYAGTTEIGTTTVTASGTWSITGITLTAGQVLTAKADATGKTISVASNSLTIGASAPAAPVVSSPILANSTSISGTSGNGTVTVFIDGTAVSTTTSGASWTLSGIALGEVYKGARITATNTVSGVQSAQSAAVIVTGVNSFKITNTSDAALGNQTAGTSFNTKLTALNGQVDGNGNGTGSLVTTFTGKVVVSSSSAIVSGGGQTANFSSGVLNPHALNLSTAGSRIVEVVSVEDPTAFGKAPVEVVAGAATKLSISAEPVSATAGTSLGSITVRIEDQYGNLATTDTRSLTLAILNNAGSPAGTLSGTLSVNAVGGIATFTGISIDRVGTGYTLRVSSSPALTTDTSAAFNITAATANKLAFGVQPSNAGQNTSISPAITVRVEDTFGNLVSDTRSITLALNTNPGSSTLAGTLTQSAVNGVATFNNIQLNNVGVGYKLVATASGLTQVISNAFSIGTAGVATTLLITTEPSATAQNGAAFAQQPQVQLKDVFGDNVSQSGVIITAAIASGETALGGTLTATTNASGVAIFSDLKLTGLIGNRTLRFTTGTLIPDTSTTINITAGAATALAISTQPSATANNAQVFAQQPVIQLKDQSGNNVSTSGVNVTVSIASGGGTLATTLTVATNSSGVATFDALKITGTIGVRTLSFASSGLTSVTSNNITLAAGTATQVVVVTQPSATATNNTAFAQQPVLQLRDVSGNDVSTSGVAVTVAIASGGGTLGTTLTVNTDASGTATFSGLKITGTTGDRTLTFSSSGLTSATSSTISITAGAATALAISTQPSATANNAQVFAQQPVIQLKDQSGNNVSTSGVNVTVSIASGGGTLATTLTVATNSSGVATFDSLKITGTIGVRTLSFASSGLTSVTSNNITLAAGTATQVVVVTQPSATATNNTAFAQQPVLQLRDVSGNDVTTSGVAVTVAIASGGGTLGTTLTVNTDASGTATFSGLKITGTTGDRTLTFSSSGLTSANSSTINITAGAATALAISTQPSATANNAQVFAQQPVIQLKDQSGNNVSTSGVNVTVSIASGGGTLATTLTVATNSSGVATFDALKITGTIGVRTLSFASSGLTSVTSNNITLAAGTATQVVVVTQPSATAANNSVFAQQPVLQLRDVSGNDVTTSGVAVTVDISSGGGTLGTTLTVNTDASGTATFSGLKITGTTGDRTLTFSSSGLTSANSSTINITAGAATALAISTQPSATANNAQVFAQQPVIQLKDQSGNNVSTSGVNVTVSIASGGGTLATTLTVATNSSGVATFDALKITGTIGVRTLSFASSGLTSVTSNNITLAAGTATQVVVVTQPSATAANNSVFAQQPVLQLRDVSGNDVTTSGVAVTVAIASGGGTLGTTLTVNTDASGTATFSGLKITGTTGDRTLTFSSSGLTSATSSIINITGQIELTVGGSFTANNKVYDGNTTASVLSNSLTLTGVTSGDVVTITPVVVFATKTVSNGKTVSLTSSSTLGGADAAKYTLSLTGAPTTTANITKKSLTVTGATASNKVYDGNTSANLTSATLSGVVSGDSVSLNQTVGTFATKTAGDGKTVTAAITLTGADTANYSLTQPTGLTANITKKGLTVTGATASNKVYDGNTSATLTNATLSGAVSGDAISLNQTVGTFATKTAGDGKTVTAAITLTGADTANYSLTQPTGLTANITKKGLTVTDATASNKVYDGNTSATLTNATLVGAVSGDAISLNQTVGTFATKTVANGKVVTSAITVQGADSANYSLTQPTGLTANITKKGLTVTGATASNKVYDGNTSATLTSATLVGAVSGDAISLNQTVGTFATKTAGDGKTVTAAITLTGADTANYSLTQPTGLTANITKKGLTVSGATASNKVYDGNTSATLTNATLSGAVSGDAISLNQTVGTFATKTAGDGKTVTAAITLTGADTANYSLTQPTGLTANITKKGLTVTGATASNKVYDGNTSATLTNATLSGAISGDAISLNQTVGTFATKTAGDGKTVTAAITLTGADTANYSLTQPTGLTANITKKGLTVTGATASNKVYDGNTGATLTNATLSGAVSGDAISLNQTVGTFATKTAGDGKTVTAAITLTGADTANYSLTQPTGLTANITKKGLTVTGATASNKVYDGNTSATLTNATLSGAVSGDAISLNQTVGTFATKTAGDGKTVTAAITLTGADTANYSLTQPTGLTANITKKGLTVTGATASNKVYDGNTSATLTNATLSGAVSGDAISLNQTVGTFATKTAGDGKTVTAAITLTGADTANYSLTQPTGLTANITKKGLTVTGATASNKVYDGNTSATLTNATLSGAVSGDAISLNQTVGTFATKTAGDGKTVTAAITLTGADTANYSLTQPTGLTANITKKGLTVTDATASNKVYDGNTSATLTNATLVGAVSGDAISLNQTVGTFATKTAGDGKTVTAAITLTGADTANYSLTQPTGLTANITKKGLTVTGATASNKVYDGNTGATLTNATLSGAVSGDAISLNQTVGTFATKTAGDGKTVTAAITLTGADTANYSLTQPTGLTANITKKGLTVTGATASNKVYDGNTSAALTNATLSGAVSGDAISLNQTVGTFATKTAGDGKTVTAAITLTGADTANYSLTQPTGLTANITKKGLTVTGATASNKVYDGNTSAALTNATLSGAVSGDAISLNQTVGTFATKTAGDGKTVTAAITLTGADTANYSLTQPTGLTANITKKGLTVTGATASNKVYDGNTSATLTNATLSGAVSGDAISLNQTVGTFATKTAGDGKTVTAAITLTGADTANYSLTQPTGLTANITKKGLTVTGATASNKVYDGNTSATLTNATLSGAVSGDAISLNQTVGTFATKTVANGKVVTSAITVQGADSANYSLTQPTGLTANITKKGLTVTGATASNKVYDGNTSATLTSATLVGAVSGDAISLNQTVGTFATKTAGDGKTVTAAITLTGADTANYSLTQPTGLTANITLKALTITGATASNKVYDGNTSATLTNATLVGAVSGDAISLNQTVGTFASKTVANGKVVTSAITITGADTANYSLTQPTGLTANITAKGLTITNATASNKVYDGNTSATITSAVLNGVVSGDAVSLNQTVGTFATKTVANAKVVTSAITLTGADTANYSLTQPTGLTANITAKGLTITNATASNKVYDGNTSATITSAVLNGVVTGDAVSLNQTVGTFASKTVANGKVVTSAITITGADTANYSLTQPTGLTANITPKALTITNATASNKVYDGNTSATITSAVLNGVVSGDAVSLNQTVGTFANKTVANGKAVTSAITITGADTANYNLTQPTGLTANITPKELTVTGASASSKVYDGNTNAVVTNAVLNGVVAGDTVTFNQQSGVFNNKNVGQAKAVTAAISLQGADLPNYTLTQPTGLQANITAKSISIGGSFTAQSKVYDGSLLASISTTNLTLAGLVSPDVLVLSGVVGQFSDRHVANGKTVRLTNAQLAGSDSANYLLNITNAPTALANITRKAVTIGGSFAAANKVFDGNTNATITNNQLVLAGLVSGDTVNLSNLAAAFTSAQVGQQIPVILQPLPVLAGVHAGNYSLDTTGMPRTAANITIGAASILTSQLTALPGLIRTIDSALVTLQLRDAAQNQLTNSGGSVQFATNFGQLRHFTDLGNGSYTAWLSSTSPGLAVISATLNGNLVVDTAHVRVITGPANFSSSQLTAVPSRLPVNDSSLVRLDLLDFYNNPVNDAGAVISFASSLGQIGVINRQNDGSYTAWLRSTLAGNAVVSATLNGTTVTDTAHVRFIAGPPTFLTSILTAADDSVWVVDSTTVQLQVRDAFGNPRQQGGDVVTMTTNLGVLGTVQDLGNGLFSARIRSTTSGFATINASLNGSTVSDTAGILFFPADVSAASGGTELIVNGDSLPADGISRALITVQLRDQFGNAIQRAGINVRFNSNFGDFVLVSNNGGNGTNSNGGIGGGFNTIMTSQLILPSDTAGKVRVNLSSIRPGLATVTAVVDHDGISQTTMLPVVNGSPAFVLFLPGPPIKLLLTSEPNDSVNNNVAFQAQPIVQLTDVNGNFVTNAGIPVTASLLGANGSLMGTVTVNSNNAGQVNYSNLAITAVNRNFRLAFNAPGMVPDTSRQIHVRCITSAVSLTQAVCAGASVQVGTQSFNTTGIHQVILSNRFGCDSVVTLNLTVRSRDTTILNQAICAGGSMAVGNTIITAAGQYHETLPNRFGCDSVVQANVVVDTVVNTFLFRSLCIGDSVVVGNRAFKFTGIYQIVLQASGGCDSIVNLNLSINPISQVVIYRTICQGDTLSFNNQSFTTAGLYNFFLISSQGCDSIATLDLTVNPLPNVQLSITGNTTFCQGDSVRLQLTAQSGNTYQWYRNTQPIPGANQAGFTARLSGNYFAIVASNRGCVDTSTSVAVNVNNLPSAQIISLSGTVFCGGDSVKLVSAAPFSSSLQYQWLLNGIPLAGATGHDRFASQAGLYQLRITNASGCVITSDTLRVSLNPAPAAQVTMQPPALTNAVQGDSVVFALAASNAVAYKWQKRISGAWVDLNNDGIHFGVTRATMKIMNLPLQYDSSWYRALTYGQCGAPDTSLSLLLRVETSNRVTTSASDYGNVRLLITPCPGDTVIAPVSVSAANSVSSFLVKLKYDTTALRYIDYLTLAPVVATANVVNQNNTVRISFTSPTTTNVPDGELIGLRFVATSSSALIWDTTGFYLDSLGFNIPTRWQNGAVEVKVRPVTNLVRNICRGDAVLIAGEAFTTSGTYTRTLQAVNSCDSIVNLTLTVVSPDTTRISRNICRGTSLMVGNVALNSSGRFEVNLTSSKGCDSLVVVNLNVINTDVDTLDVFVCHDGYFVVGAITFTQTGTYSVPLMNTAGCDSVIILNLFIRPNVQTTLNDSVCFGSSFIVGSTSFNQTGNYSVVLNDINGCDSTVNLNLFVMPRDTTFVTDTICAGDSVTVGSQRFGTAGVYHVILINSLNCDSTVQLTLRVNPVDTTQLSRQICQGQSFTVGTQSFSVAGNYTVLLTNQYGCDSTVLLALTVNPISSTNLVRVICSGQSVTIGTQTFSSTGVYSVTLTNQFGCDSVVQLNLTVSNSIRVNNPVSICIGSAYQLPSGNNVSVPGTYMDTLTAQGGCDSIITTILTNYPAVTAIIDGTNDNCIGNDINLNVIGGVQASWTGPNGFSSANRNIVLPAADLNTAGWYYATVTSTEGCTATDSIQVGVRDCRFLIPQGISPNGDGYNDVFFINGLDQYPNCSVKIYNRAGSLVYKALPYRNDWNGDANHGISGELTQGTYYYLIDLGDGQKPMSGFVFISR